MESKRDNYESREELYSKAVRAGKRTYFFDVKATKSDDKYITITESKRRFDNESGKFSYEKHKLFLFKEDFEKFLDGFQNAVNYINGELITEIEEDHTLEKLKEVDFDSLDS
ncbi:MULTISPECIES: DUF3276 family protein [unclassified Lentimicrobium]|uniref:DUF3276 family protein n=1 Tax=unclassified Lentimicrobium TaxID=2677434 RepID=UPI0015574689|nr:MULTISPECIES: DUF3276 family protein [unclassified Lentimicrobium]NPD46004.1 DUF3276 family protein [Lentimicrobium sp. S6]NPD85204.1 DUF3276 family protein [Lentimicrobium sp. L6]